MNTHYNPAFVALSYVIALISSYLLFLHLRYVEESAPVKDRVKPMLFVSIVCGSGVWSMHFLGMIAFHPSFHLAYDIPVTVLSLFISIGAVFLSLVLFVLYPSNTYGTILAGTALGGGASIMHVVGMSGVVTSSHYIQYDSIRLSGSIMFAVFASLASMHMENVFNRLSVRTANLVKAALLGTGITGMHYMAMAGTHFIEKSVYAGVHPHPFTMGQTHLGLWVGATITLLFVVLFIVAVAEKAASRSAIDSYRVVLESLCTSHPDMLWLLNMDGRVVTASPALMKALGYRREEMTNQHQHNFIIPSHRSMYEDYFTRLRQGEPQTFTLHMLHKNKDAIALNVAAFPILSHGSVIKVIVSYTFANGMPEGDRDDAALLGKLAAMVAHEVRNPLTTINGLVRLLQNGSRKETYFPVVFSEINQINQFIDDLLLMENPESMLEQADATADIGHAMQNALDKVSDLANSSCVRIQIIHDQDIPLCRCEEKKLERVFYHLLKNGIEAMPGGGDLHVMTQRSEQGDIVVKIKDHGKGMPPEQIREVGTPLYTTKGLGSGVGLGVVYRVLEAYKGRLVISSVPDNGTTVEVILPTT